MINLQFPDPTSMWAFIAKFEKGYGGNTGRFNIYAVGRK